MPIGVSGSFNASLGGVVNVNASASVGLGGVNVNVNFGANAAMPGTRVDPYMAYDFIVEIEGLITGGFTDVSGLSIQIDVDRKMFGGDNSTEYKFVKSLKYPDLVFKRGISDQDLMWGWYQAVINGSIQRKSGSIFLLDQTKNRVRGWHFFEAYPIKWEGPALNSARSAVATESLTLTHHGLTRIQ